MANDKNLLVIGYYKFEENYFAYGDYFKNNFKTVSFFPLIELMDRLGDKSKYHSVDDIRKIIAGEDVWNESMHINNIKNTNTKLCYEDCIINFDCNNKKICENLNEHHCVIPNYIDVFGKVGYTNYLINTSVKKDVVIISHSVYTLNNLCYNDNDNLIKIIDYIYSLKQQLDFELIQINWDPITYEEHFKLNNIISKFDKCFCTDPIYSKVFNNCHYFKVGFNSKTSYNCLNVSNNNVTNDNVTNDNVTNNNITNDNVSNNNVTNDNVSNNNVTNDNVTNTNVTNDNVINENDTNGNVTNNNVLEDFTCDVLFIGTNLYIDDMFKNKTFTRKQVLDLLYQDKTIKLHTYGCEDLKKYYPESYKGFLPYNQCYKAFSGAKICLNISHIMDEQIPILLDNIAKNNLGDNYTLNNNDNNVFFSDRVAQIIACESIVLSNNDYKNTLTKNHDYIFLNNLDDLIPTIHNFLSNTEIYENMKANSIKRKPEFEYGHIIKNLTL